MPHDITNIPRMRLLTDQEVLNAVVLDSVWAPQPHPSLAVTVVNPLPVTIGDIDIGSVNLRNVADVLVNPATEDTLQLVRVKLDSLYTDFVAEDFATQATLLALKTRADLLAEQATLLAMKLQTDKLVFDANSYLKVILPPPTAPVGTTAVEQPAYPNDVVAITDNQTLDISYVIPNGQTLTIQRFKVGANDGGTGKNVLFELYYDPLGTLGVGTERLAALYVNASNFESVIERTFVGDGTKRILLRATQQGSANMQIARKWTGFTVGP